MAIFFWRATILLLVAFPLASAQAVASQYVSDANAWGDPVDGVQLRLAVSKNPPPYLPPQLPGDLPYLEMQIRNVGTDTVTFNCYIGQTAQIEIDGTLYDQGVLTVTASCAPPPGLGPGSQSANISLSLQTLVVNRKSVPADKLDLKPGKHTIRVKTPSGDWGVFIGGSTVITLVSNAITIDIPDLSPAAETQMLIEQASVGGTMRGFMAARRLVEKHPKVALDAIQAAVRATPDAGTRSKYVHLAGELPGDAPVDFLGRNLRRTPGFFLS